MPDTHLRQKVAECLFRDRYVPYKWEQATDLDRQCYMNLADKILSLLPQATEEVKECQCEDKSQIRLITHCRLCGLPQALKDVKTLMELAEEEKESMKEWPKESEFTGVNSELIEQMRLDCLKVHQSVVAEKDKRIAELEERWSKESMACIEMAKAADRYEEALKEIASLGKGATWKAPGSAKNALKRKD